MTFVLITFAVTSAIVLGAYWAFVVRPESQDKDQLTGRLRNFKVKAANITIANEVESSSDLLGLHAALEKRRGLVAPLEQLLVESGLKMTPAGFILWTFGGIVVGSAIGWWTGRLAVGILVSVILAIIPLIYVRRVRTKRLQTFEEQFPEAVELIARALRAGHAFTTGLGMVADEVPKPAGPEFRRVYDEQNFGMSLTEALRAMARRVPVLDARFFVTAVLTQRESGGNLSEVLDNLASVMRERFKVKRQIRVISAHGRLSAWILSSLAPALAGVLFLMSPEFMRILWEDPLGLQLVLAAVTLQLTGTFIISRMVKIGTDMDQQVLSLIGLLFVSIAAATGVAVWLLTDPQFAQRRLSQISRGAPEGAGKAISIVGYEQSDVAKRVRSFVPKSPKEMGRIERMLAMAGYYGPWPATLYAIVQLALPLILGGAVIYFFGTSVSILVFAGLAAALGYYTPDLWMGRAIEARKREISNGLPDAIDLLIVCIESGSGIDQALSRVGDELSIAYPALSAEIELLCAETRAGKPRLDAFRNFADRTKVDDVRSLVNMLIQTDKFGTSIGQALRTHAEVSRTKRRQRAEEKAAKLGVKLLFPLVFCIFPAFYLVVIGPSMLRIFRDFVWGGGGL